MGMLSITSLKRQNQAIPYALYGFAAKSAAGCSVLFIRVIRAWWITSDIIPGAGGSLERTDRFILWGHNSSLQTKQRVVQCAVYKTWIWMPEFRHLSGRYMYKTNKHTNTSSVGSARLTYSCQQCATSPPVVWRFSVTPSLHRSRR